MAFRISDNSCFSILTPLLSDRRTVAAGQGTIQLNWMDFFFLRSRKCAGLRRFILVVFCFDYFQEIGKLLNSVRFS